MGFFASPAKPWLSARVKARIERPGMARLKSDTGDHVMLGVPVDAEKELNEIVSEVKAEIERRKSQGINVPDVRALVREKLGSRSAERRSEKKEL
jgi:hypothetical protein